MRVAGFDLGEAPSGELPEPHLPWSIDQLESARCEAQTVRVAQSNDIRTQVRRYRSGRPTRHVVLIHGASAGSRTFMVPNGGLIRHLVQRSFDVWTLDWRSSNLFAQFNPVPDPDLSEPIAPGLSPYAQQFDLDQAAREDLTQSLQAIGLWLQRETGSTSPVELSLVAHCVGGGLVAQAIAMGLFASVAGADPASFRLGAIVFSTLALFYRVGLEGWLKGNEYLLERLTSEVGAFTNPIHPVISPAVALHTQRWPPALESAFDLWRKTPLAPGAGGDARATPFVERIAFMYGMPYNKAKLEELHGSPALYGQFGDMPLKIYMHCVRNLRIGHAAPFRGKLRQYVDPTHFVNAREEPIVPMTFITGAENQVWHRDSIDRCHEWLLNHTRASGHPQLVKHVLPQYAHQDLFWARTAAADVYPLIAKGLQSKPLNVVS